MRPILLLGVGLLASCSWLGLPSGEAPSTVRAGVTDPELCAEHGVLESVCTKCNPALKPVFEARGDWCPEHGFPESFCPICSPEAGGRPRVQDVSPDGSPPDGTLVRFQTREAAELAGIETMKAKEADWIGGTAAVAHLEWDATRVAAVSARAPGVVTSIEADVGTRVVAGDVLARMRSATVGGDRSRVAAATRRVAVAEAEVARKRDLRAAGVTSEREVLAAEQALATAQAELAGLRGSLGLVGAGAGDTYALTAPLAGVVTERTASVGQAVDGTTPLFHIVDPSRMWAELDVSEADLGVVSEGQEATIVLDALPDQAFTGRLDYLAPSVDPDTRTAKGRVVLENPDGRLRAHMYGTAHLVTDEASQVVIVPASAVQPAGDVQLVFVREAPDRFVARRVRVVARAGDEVRVAGPIRPGDPVATTGAFLLKTETLKDSIGAGCCEGE